MSTYATDLATLLGALRDAARTQNPDLSLEGLRKQRDAARATAFTKANDTITANAALARTAADQAMTNARAKIGAGNDATTLVLREQQWTRVRMLLEAGRNLADVIATTTDPGELAAIADWAPTWVRAQSPQPTMAQPFYDSWAEPDTQWIDAVVVARLATVDPIRFGSIAAATAQATVGAAYANAVADLQTNDTANLSIASKRSLSSADPAGFPAVQAADTLTTV
jgi:hypothetical protein